MTLFPVLSLMVVVFGVMASGLFVVASRTGDPDERLTYTLTGIGTVVVAILLSGINLLMLAGS